MNLAAFLKELAEGEGVISLHQGVVTFENCLQFDVAEAIKEADEMKGAFAFLLADVEATACEVGAYGFPVEDEQHPFHESVLRARLALGISPAPVVVTGKIWWCADNAAEADLWKIDLMGKGAIQVELKPEEDRKIVDVIITVDRSRANEILGYEIEDHEWLDESEDDATGVADETPPVIESDANRVCAMTPFVISNNAGCTDVIIRVCVGEDAQWRFCVSRDRETGEITDLEPEFSPSCVEGFDLAEEEPPSDVVAAFQSKRQEAVDMAIKYGEQGSNSATA